MTLARRIANAAFAGHLLLIAFSTVSMMTILDGPPGPWVATEPAATVMRLSFRFAGPTYVVLGMAAALAVLVDAVGVRRATGVTAAAIGISLGAELAGTSTGLPFGDYAYSALLGYRVLGRVPFPIPLSWFYMLVGALAMVARFRPARGERHEPWIWAVVAALLLVAWDISMDPAMVKTGHWAWGEGAMFRDAGLPAWLVAFFTRDVFYGMPLANWFGWFLTAVVIARVMTAIVTPQQLTAGLARSRLPIALYLANGVMPIALCVREEAWWAAGIGALAMATPAAVAWSRGTPPQSRTVGERVPA